MLWAKAPTSPMRQAAEASVKEMKTLPQTQEKSTAAVKPSRLTARPKTAPTMKAANVPQLSLMYPVLTLQPARKPNAPPLTASADKPASAGKTDAAKKQKMPGALCSWHL